MWRRLLGSVRLNTAGGSPRVFLVGVAELHTNGLGAFVFYLLVKLGQGSQRIV